MEHILESDQNSGLHLNHKEQIWIGPPIRLRRRTWTARCKIFHKYRSLWPDPRILVNSNPPNLDTKHNFESFFSHRIRSGSSPWLANIRPTSQVIKTKQKWTKKTVHVNTFSRDFLKKERRKLWADCRSKSSYLHNWCPFPKYILPALMNVQLSSWQEISQSRTWF